ncbi:peroxisome biosynthesis protein (peroxin-2) [Ophiostoma piceae UAMH 11346]|uniref:Peroxisome biosynthesis protein (Peroxin-2) n=1 Tax=Ophiostoma piceae (strain UAMH 11346) TaxID=1262450 RepID=S3CJV4_OPHP1|nr:peroxisome biosynthesis protein (peroxin-2) [Ophiostoma piceae UAMH 11346]
MSDRIPPAGASSILAPETLRAMNATSLPASSSSSTTTSTSFAEAQRRLADLRQQRAAADAQRRAHDAAAATAQREAAAAARRARLAESQSSLFSPAASLSRISNSALVAWDGVTHVASTISSKLGGSDLSSSPTSLGSRPAFRVSQVDAELLDEELLELLRSQVADALQYIRGGTLQDDWQPEVMLVLRAALFKLSVWDNNATYGASLQNLRYADARGTAIGKGGPAVREAVPIAPSKWQKTIYGLVTVGGQYAWTKWEDWLRDNNGEDDEDDYYEEGQQPAQGQDGETSQTRTLLGRIRLTPKAVQKLARATSTVSNVYAGAAFVSFLVFLRYGRYRTLLDRVLRMRLVPPTSQVSREVSFEYLNRQLVWHAFTEFLLFLLPLVGINRWRRWLTRVWRRTRGAATSAVQSLKRKATGDSTEDDDDEKPAEKTGELSFLPERTCAICYQDQNTATSEADIMAAAAASSGVIGSAETDITNPYEAIPCGCVYCYVSIATRLEREEGDGWTCLRCGTLVTACKPWSGDVLAPASASAFTPAETAPAASDDFGASGILVGEHDSRPSSSSTNASGGSPYTQKTVGFADDVKGEDGESSSNGEIMINEMEDESDEQVDVLDDGRSDVDDEGNSESEAYEEDEDIVESDGEGDDDVEEE